MEVRFLRKCVACAAMAAVLAMTAPPASAQEGAEKAEEKIASEEKGLSDTSVLLVGGFAAASFCVAVSVIGAAYAVAKVGTAAMGAVAEKPELMGRSMVYVGLAEGLAIYGLIVAIMILGKLPG